MNPTKPEQSLRLRSACAGLDPSLWYPDQGATARGGRAICATCPVLPLCLELALARGEKHGVWGGASERERRRLAVVWVQRAHDYRPGCGSPRCRWCRAVDAHRAACAGDQPGPLQWNGPGARHGFKSTYARGCRGVWCSVAISSVGEQLRAAGWDVAAWCERWFGPCESPVVADDGRRHRLIAYARRLAEFDSVSEVAA